MIIIVLPHSNRWKVSSPETDKNAVCMNHKYMMHVQNKLLLSYDTNAYSLFTDAFSCGSWRLYITKRGHGRRSYIIVNILLQDQFQSLPVLSRWRRSVSIYLRTIFLSVSATAWRILLVLCTTTLKPQVCHIDNLLVTGCTQLKPIIQ